MLRMCVDISAGHQGWILTCWAERGPPGGGDTGGTISAVPGGRMVEWVAHA